MTSSMVNTYTSNNLFILLKVFWIITKKCCYICTVREQILTKKGGKINSTIKTVGEAQGKYKPSVILFKHHSFAVLRKSSSGLWKKATDLCQANSNIWKYVFKLCFIKLSHTVKRQPTIPSSPHLVIKNYLPLLIQFTFSPFSHT